MRTGSSFSGLSVTGIVIFTCLFLSCIYKRNKLIQVELTKYFESKESYGNRVIFIDQDRWISAQRGILYLWEKDKVKKTYNLPGYNGDPLVHNNTAGKVYAGPYILDLNLETTELVQNLSFLITEGMESPPSPSSGSLDVKQMTWDKDGKSALVFAGFFPSRAMETTRYSGIKSRLLLIDPVSGTLKKTLWESKNKEEDFILNITDKYLIAAGENLLVFEKSTGKLNKETEEGGFAILSLALNKSNTLLAAGKADGTLEIYKINEGWKSFKLAAHNSRILTLDFHPETDILASGAEDKLVKFWKAEKGSLLSQKEMSFENTIEGLAFDKEGKRLSVSEKMNDERMQQFTVNVRK